VARVSIRVLLWLREKELRVQRSEEVATGMGLAGEDKWRGNGAC